MSSYSTNSHFLPSIVFMGAFVIFATACSNAAPTPPPSPSVGPGMATLAVLVEPPDKGRVDTGDNGSAAEALKPVRQGDAIRLLARSVDQSYTFDHWEGDLSGSQADQELRIDSNKTVRAVFVRSNESKTLVARFTASAISGPAPLTVDFTDSSLGEPKRLEWDFDNDRTVDSSAKSQKWTYAHAGVYSVRLRVIRAGVSDLLVREGIITVYEPKP